MSVRAYPRVSRWRAAWLGALCLARVAAPAQGAGSSGSNRLYDAEAVALIYVPILSGLAIEHFASPPAEPLLFSPDEGGAEIRGNTVPSVAVGVLAGAGMLSVGLSAGPGQPYHFKGLTESLSVTFLLTQTAKITFGRHRPDYLPTSTELDDRRSFMSGHASHTLATTTYLALYLDAHVFPKWRASGSRFAWWETLPHAALAGLSFYIPYSRVQDHRHHPTDVMAGALLGLTSSILFFTLHERRFERDQTAGASDPETTQLSLSETTPPMFSLGGSF
jgi:membrane-associated phospholipid phosphatase